MKNDNIEIIYPDKDSMRRVAGVLERSLQNYKIPLKVRQKTGINSMNDITEKWLIVLCDPDAVTDKKIKKRIRDYSKKGQYSHILSLLVSGGSKNSFPNELKYEERPDGTIVEHEPLAANISSETIDESLKKLKVEQLRLLAPMLGVSFDELNRRREKQLMQTAMIVGGALLLFAILFLVFAAIRMGTISSRNDSLESEYGVTESARLEAEQERDEADRQFASLVATSARLALENKDMELALLLSMEVLPGAGEGSDAEAVLEEALNALSGNGYVPVTSGDAYLYDRYEENSQTTEEAEIFPKQIRMRIPDGYAARDAISFTLNRVLISEKHGYALYNGSFYGINESGEDIGKIFFNRICFSDDNLDDYYIYTEDGNPADFSYTIVLPDGTLLGRDYVLYVGYKYLHYDPFLQEFLKDVEVKPLEDDVRTSELMILEDNGYFMSMGMLYGDKISYVYSCDSFEQLEIMDGTYEIEKYDNIPYLLGRTSTGIRVIDPITLDCINMIEDEYSSPGPSLLTFSHPEYGDYIVLIKNSNEAVYDLKNGNRIFTLDFISGNGYGRDLSSGWYYDWHNVFSSEGYYAVGNGTSLEIYRIWDGTLYEKIENIGDNASAEMFGPYDPVTGCRSASAIWVGNGIVYEYHETARQVPETLEERLALATELLNGRTLTDEERKTYGL